LWARSYEPTVEGALVSSNNDPAAPALMTAVSSMLSPTCEHRPDDGEGLAGAVPVPLKAFVEQFRQVDLLREHRCWEQASVRDDWSR
jgi:hypothetical protein